MPRKIKIDDKQNNNIMTIAQLCEVFIKHCIIAGYADATISHYNEAIHNFGLHIDISEAKIDDLSDETIEGYTTYLQNKKTKNGYPLKGKTVATYLVGIRTILNWGAAQGYISKIKVVIPKYDQALKQSYTEQQLKALIKKPDLKTCHFTDIRDWALVNYFLGTGQRLSTVIYIRIKDVDFNDNTVTLYKLKNRSQVILPLASSVISTIKEYLKYRKGAQDDFLFCNATGEQLSIRGAQDAVACIFRSSRANCTGF